MAGSIFSSTSTYDLLKDQYPHLITIPTAAQICDNHVSTWYKWISDNEMPVPSVMLGKSRRIRLIDLCEYLDSQVNASAPTTTTIEAKTKKDGAPKKNPGRHRKFNIAALSHA